MTGDSLKDRVIQWTGCALIGTIPAAALVAILRPPTPTGAALVFLCVTPLAAAVAYWVFSTGRERDRNKDAEEESDSN